jgi:hypothetical protein
MDDEKFYAWPLEQPEQRGKPKQAEDQEQRVAGHIVGEVQKDRIEDNQRKHQPPRERARRVDVKEREEQCQRACLDGKILEGNQREIRGSKGAKDAQKTAVAHGIEIDAGIINGRLQIIIGIPGYKRCQRIPAFEKNKLQRRSYHSDPDERGRSHKGKGLNKNKWKTCIKSAVMIKMFTIAVPLAGLIVTVLTFYYVRLDRGRVEMTRASCIQLQPGDGRLRVPAIVLATLIHGTSDRGLYVENVSVRVEREDGVQHFNECWYEDRGALHAAAFLADKQGLSTNFYFYSPGYGGLYQFLPGNYTLHIFVMVTGEPERQIGEAHLTVTPELYRAVRKRNCGLVFTWSPGGKCYIGHIGPKGPKLNLCKINSRIL